MDVWIVEKYGVESLEILEIYDSSQKAEKAIIKARNEEVIDLKKKISFFKKERNTSAVKMYERMIENLTKGNDWRKWGNYPHTNFGIMKRKVK